MSIYRHRVSCDLVNHQESQQKKPPGQRYNNNNNNKQYFHVKKQTLIQNKGGCRGIFNVQGPNIYTHIN